MWFKKKKSQPLAAFLNHKFEEEIVKSEEFYKSPEIQIPQFEDDLIPLEFDNVGSYKHGALTKR